MELIRPTVEHCNRRELIGPHVAVQHAGGNSILTILGYNNIVKCHMPLDKLVYICLLRYADKNTREAFPDQGKIGKDIGISRQKVNASIDILAKEA